MLSHAPLSSGARDTLPSMVLRHQPAGPCMAVSQGNACLRPLHSNSVWAWPVMQDWREGGAPGRAWRTAPARRPGGRARGPPQSRSWCAACAPAPPGPSGSACPSCSCWGPYHGSCTETASYHVMGFLYTAKHAAFVAESSPPGPSRNAFPSCSCWGPSHGSCTPGAEMEIQMVTPPGYFSLTE